MAAELIVISGPHSGTRHGITDGQTEVGRAPSRDVVLAEPDIAWRHCCLVTESGRTRIRDLNTGAGTFVNGMKVTTHLLEDGDQITLGDTVFVYRDVVSAEVDASSRVTLLRACTLLFLFRSLATSTNSAQSELIETHIGGLLAELAPCDSASVLIAATENDVRAAAQERGDGALVGNALANGPTADAERGQVAVPIYAAGIGRGAIVARFSHGDFDTHLEVLSAVSTLAAVALENVREVEALKTENAMLQQRLTADDFGIVGKSAAMRRLLQVVERVARQDTTVLILGESGTGKELIAQALHRASPRNDKPFLAINCAAITETLLESELFGHEKGSFTGAVAQKKGKLEVAEGGTVFLDEIGELAAPLQAKLLRVLQQREFERVGGTRTIPLNVRIVAATNRDLNAEARKGRFREDLYHRLNVVALHMPPLRERPEDIPLLAEHFLRKSARRIGRAMAGITPEAERVLIRYAWPGNVRELENAMERGVVLSDSEWLTPEDMPETITGSVPALPELKNSFESTVGDAKRDAILRAWEEASGDYKIAADLLGIHPNSLLRLIRRYGLRDTLRRGAKV